MRVVIDTNVVLSGLAYPASVPGRVMQLWTNRAIEAVVSEYLLDEIARVLPRMNTRLKWTTQEQQDYVEMMRILCEVVAPAQTDAVRDKNDNPILGTLIASRADYLITGDKDLLVLLDQYAVVTPAQFLLRHGNFLPG